MTPRDRYTHRSHRPAAGRARGDGAGHGPAGPDRIERAVRTLRQQVHHVPADLDAAIAEVDVFMQAQGPYGRQLAVREAARAEQALVDLGAALADARTAVIAHAGALRTLADAVAARRARLDVLGEDDPQERQLAHARLAHGRLQRLAEQVEPWRPTAVDTVARFTQATVIALRRHQVDQLRRELAALKTRRDALAEPDAHDQDAAALLARMVARLGHPLPVATIRWPKSADPFAAPVLEEPA
jgi:hypothetical protein